MKGKHCWGWGSVLREKRILKSSGATNCMTVCRTFTFCPWAFSAICMLPGRGRASSPLPTGFFHVLTLIFGCQVDTSPCSPALPRPSQHLGSTKTSPWCCELSIAYSTYCPRLLQPTTGDISWKMSTVLWCWVSSPDSGPVRVFVHRQACRWWWLGSAQCWVSLVHHNDSRATS